ncbi:MAG: alpha/beta hydrolase [Pseudomonadota bacterium]
MPTGATFGLIRAALLLGACCLLGATASQVARAAQAAGSGEANAQPPERRCTLYGGGGANRIDADCVSVTRPLDPERPDGEQLELTVAILKSLAPQPAQDAFTLINGGPGGSSIELLVDLAPLLTGILRERDIVVVDQRGTGLSHPLHCDILDSVETEPDAEATRAAAEDCIANLDVDPRFFTTSLAVDDLDAVRATLGYDALTVYGVSYGTRVAQHYARKYAPHTRALIIDGVVPLPAALGPDIARNGQATLDSIFQRCEDDDACATAFPKLADDFQRLSEQLKRQPQPLTLPHPVTGVAESLSLSYGHLAVAIRLGAYAPETAALIPLQIDAAANKDNFLPVAAQALQVMDQLGTSISYGMHNAVVCAEDVPNYSFDPKALREELQDTFLGYEQVEALQVICEVWPKGPVDPGFHEPLRSAVPTLLLSGEFDPITPPANAEAVIPGLTDARHIVAPGQGHGVISRGCIPRLIREFTETADAATLDTTCVERMRADPFFVDLMGPPR